MRVNTFSSVLVNLNVFNLCFQNGQQLQCDLRISSIFILFMDSSQCLCITFAVPDTINGWDIYLIIYYWNTFKKTLKITNFFYSISLKSPDSSLLLMIMLILTIIVVFGLLFVICEFGERLMNKFEEFNDGLCECQWYFHPIGLQRMYLTFGVETQQPVYIRGYGNVSTTRDTMKKVSLIIYSQNCEEEMFRTFAFLKVYNTLYIQLFNVQSSI